MMRALAGVLGGNGSAARHCRAMLGVMTASPAKLVLAEPAMAMGASDYRPESRNAAIPAQPTHSEERRSFLVADTRLDNRAELSHDLGLPLDTPDDGLLLQAWHRWGVAMVDHLLGGFAFACWDARERTLFMVRDHAGERPLHFVRSPSPAEGFAFASMPLALCALPWVGHAIDLPRMAHFLAVLTPQDTQTFFRGVERLLPGHWLKLTPTGIEIRRYWHPADTKPVRYRRDEEYIDDFRERLDCAVGARLAGAEGFAAELSGGLDSSSVTVTAARLLAAQEKRLTAFTAVPLPGFNGGALPGRFGDEGPMAAEVAALYPNIDHVRIDTAGRDLLESAALAARLTGQPTFNPTNQLWVDAILDGVRSRGLGVLLQGVSGNATISFGGLIGLSDLFRRGRWFTLLRQTRELRAGGHTSWRGAAAWATGPVTPQWMRRLFHPEMREFSFAFSPVHPDRAMEYRLRERVLEAFYGSEDSSAAVRRQMYEYYDPGVANASAAAGWQVEQRDPTQDKRIYEFCFGIPIEQYLAGGQSRSLIRRAMQGRLPEATVRRTNRGLQAADWYLVMGEQRGRLAAELTRIEHSPMVRHLIDTARLRTLLENWPSSGYDDPKVNEVWHLALSRGIAAGSFVAQYDPEMPQEIDAPLQIERPGARPGLSSRQNA